MDFTSSEINPLKGFYHSASDMGSLSKSATFTQEISLSMNLLLVDYTNYLTLFSYSMNGWEILFKVNYSDQTQLYGLTICFDELCKSLNNCAADSNIFLGKI